MPKNAVTVQIKNGGEGFAPEFIRSGLTEKKPKHDETFNNVAKHREEAQVIKDSRVAAAVSQRRAEKRRARQ